MLSRILMVCLKLIVFNKRMYILRNAHRKMPFVRRVRADAISIDATRNIADTHSHIIRCSPRCNMRCNDNAMRSQEQL